MKNKLILILSVLCVVLIVSLNTAHSNYVRQKNLAKTFERTISDMGQDIKQERIRLNDSINVYMATIRDLHLSKKNVEDLYSKVLKASNTKAKDVNSITELGSVVYSTDTVIAQVDTFGGLRAQVIDDWARIDVEVKPDRQTIVDYCFKDSLSVISIQKKHSILFGLIKWKSLESTKVINHNPKSQIVGLQKIDIIE